ncbi:hypothetical protein BA190_26880 [Labrys sp. WJW]|uniref:hypothetical protein n=1 Tax=Labrys sp. WJW TaxID=1737983 RepID=UPI000830EEA8|nr:hypothetical protein [Labrys sp. WJW]OCC01840.1 hypothetical protein BA190_26880 [Labrys sp. WJW]
MSFCAKALRRLDSQTPVGDAAGNATSTLVQTSTYATNDAAATVETAGYFNAARDAGRVSKGDIILATMVNAGTPVLKAYVVTAAPVPTGNVTIALAATAAG